LSHSGSLFNMEQALVISSLSSFNALFPSLK
jgi:hypothetical protein